MQKQWTEEEISYLRERIGKDTWATIAKKLGRTEKAVSQKAFKMGISSDGYSPWSQKEVAFLLENFRGMSLQELASCLGRTETSVHSKAYKIGLRHNTASRRPHSRKLWRAEDDMALRDMSESMTAVEIAERLGRTVDSVRSRCKVLGIRLQARCRKAFWVAWPPDKLALLRAGAKEGKSLGMIADEVGKTAPAVLKALRRLGIERAALSKTKPVGRPRKNGASERKARKRVAPPVPDGWILRKDAEPIVGVGLDRMKALCRSGKVEAKKDELGRWIVLRESAERYAEERKTELARKVEERIAVHEAAKKAAQTAPKRAKPKLELSDEAQVAGMSKLDILKALAGL